MKLQNIIKLALVALASKSVASTTITSGNVGAFKDNANLNVANDSIFAIVVSTGDAEFTSITAGTIIAEGGFIDGGDDYFLTVSQVRDATLGRSFGSADKPGFDLINGMSAGDPFILYWFPSSTIASNVAANGQFYGSARFEDGNTAENGITEWFLSGDNESTNAASILNPELGGSASLIADIEIGGAPIPEPTSLALLGLGAFGLIARRRRG